MEPITEGMWGVPGTARLPGGITFPLRMTVIRLPDGGLWLHSAVSIDDRQAAAIEAKGPVRHIVAPTKMHHLFLGAAHARWPDATVHAAVGMEVEGVRIDARLSASPDPAWGGAFRAYPLQGASRLEEVVFLHEPSKTLLISDLVFNFQGSNMQTRLMLWAVGCAHGMASSRSLGWVFVDDRAAFGASVRDVLAWDFDRVVPCHGEIVSDNAHRTFASAVQRVRHWR